MSYGIVNLDKWLNQEASGALVLTPPKEWEGLVQLRDVRGQAKSDGSPLVAYGTQGLVNYREYVRRYLPWRTQDERHISRTAGSAATCAWTLLDIATAFSSHFNGQQFDKYVDALVTAERLDSTEAELSGDTGYMRCSSKALRRNAHR